MTIQKFSRLPALSQICTLCNKYLEAKDIIENNYIEILGLNLLLIK